MLAWSRTHSSIHIAGCFSELWGVSLLSLLTPEPLHSTSQPAGSDWNMAEPRCNNTFTRERSRTLEPVTVYASRARPVITSRSSHSGKWYEIQAHEPHKIFRTISSNRRTVFFTRTHSQTRTTLPTTPPRGLIILRDQLLEPTPHRPRMY